MPQLFTLRGASRLGLLPDDEYLYHVTFYGRLESIAEEGLRPGAARAIGAQTYDSNRKGKVFFTERAGLFTWFGHAETWADEYRGDHDDPTDEDGGGGALTPVVLRLTADSLPEEEQPDEIANDETTHAHAWYVTKVIPPRVFEVWNGTAWVDLVDEWNSINPAKSYKHEGSDENADWDENGDGWWELLDWRTNPLFPPEAAP